MKSPPVRTLLTAILAFYLAPLHGEDTERVSYEPAVVTLIGVVVEEGYGNDSSPHNRDKVAWILRLDRPISVPAKAGDEINTEEKNVTEVHLNVSHTKHPIPKGVFGKERFTATGTLYHRHNGNHLRPIVMLVSDLKSTETKSQY